MQSKTDISYGVIPITRVGDEWKVFLINQFSRIGNNTYWVFPKGHPYHSETPLETAVRELREETNLTVKTFVENQTFTLKYTFMYDGVRIKKQVVYYVGIIVDTKAKLDETEVKEGGWYSLEEAAERVDYKDTKQMFIEARMFIENLNFTT